MEFDLLSGVIDDLCGTRHNSKLCELAVRLPLASLDYDVTHLLVKVGVGGIKTSASHRLQHFHTGSSWKVWCR